MDQTPLPAQGPVDVNVSRQDCYAEDGAPIKCWKCGSTEQREEVRSMVDVLHGQGPVCEYEVFCAECGTGIGYWAYGSFDPGYMRDMTANINVKIAEAKVAEQAHQNREKKQKIMAILEQKSDMRLAESSIEELEAMLNTL